MAEEIDEKYCPYWDEFKLRADENGKTVGFLKKIEKCNFAEINSMISIGAGEIFEMATTLS